jgi:acetate---CoA ligase (ADP-forming)
VRAAASHTANMAGSYDIYRAAFRDAGVIEVHDMEEAADFIQALLGQPPAAGRNVAIMGGSGGSAVVFSDAADAHGLTLARLAPETMKVLRDNLPSVASLDNPVDYAAGFLNDQNAPRFQRALEAVLGDPGIDQLGFMFATVIGRTGALGATALAEAAAHHRKPIFAFSSVPRETAPEMFEILGGARIPIIRSVNRVAKAMRMLADHAQALQRAKNVEQVAHVAPGAYPLPPATGPLDERESKEVLRAFGIPVTDDCLLPAEPLGTARASFSYPVALKIVSRDIAHKSDVGGVRLNIETEDALRTAVDEMLQGVRGAAPRARLAGMLVSPMIRDGMETIVGVVNDAVFGPVVAFGLGGIHAEILNDVTYRPAPFDVAAGKEMINALRASRLFDGVRGAPARDVEALAQALAAVSQLAWSLRERLAELDINPLLVRPRGAGVVAVDALLVLR